MRKKIAVFLVAMLAMFAFAGCTTSQQDLYTSLKNMSTWKATEIKESGQCIIEVQGEKITMDFDVTGYSNNENMSAYVNMNMGITMGGETYKISDVKVYLVDNKLYINKDTFIKVCQLSKQEVPSELQNLDGDYICMGDMTEQMTEEMAQVYKLFGADGKNPTEQIYTMYEKIGKDLGIDIPVTKEGNKYSVALNGEQVIDLVVQSIEKGIANLENLNKTLELKLTPEQIKEVKEGYEAEKATMLEQIKTVKPMGKNSNISYTFEPKDKEYTQTMEMTVKVPEIVNMTAKINAVGKQAEPKEIKLPGKVSSVKFEELMEALVPTTAMIDMNEKLLYGNDGEPVAINVIEKDGAVYLPLKAIMKVFGEEVVYNTQTKQVGIKTETGITPVKGMVKNSTTYVSLDEMKALGFKVEHNKEYKMVTIVK
ncbi:MAG: hypothetical protein AB9856_17835 [Cellulosilyticaceae bacterium]